MLREYDPVRRHADFTLEQRFDPQFLFKPTDSRLAECAPRARKCGEIAEENTLELQQRLLIEDNIVEVACRNARLAKAEFHSLRWEARVMFLSCESLLLDRK